MLSRERQALGAARRIYRSGARTPEAILRIAVTELLGMGGLYVKFAQLLLLNPVFSKTVPPELRRQIFDRVKFDENAGLDYYLPASEIEALRGELKLLSPQPLFAGSFAAVFEAELKTGEKVVIKVLRPELDKTLKQDLRLLAIIAKPVKMLNEEIRAALQGVMKSFRQAILLETNYTREVANAHQLERTFKNDPTIYIPKTYDELCTPTRIVQEKLEGVWLSEVLELSKQGQSASDYVRERIGSNLERQLYGLGVSSLYHSLQGEVVHGDPHPGNLVLLPNNQVGMIDFGLIAPPLENRLALLNYVKLQAKIREGEIDVPKLILTILRFHANYLYRAMVSLSRVFDRPLLDEMYVLLQIEMEQYKDLIDTFRFKQGDYSNVLSSNINKNNRFGLLPKMDNPLTQKAFVALWRTNEEFGMNDLTTKIFNGTTELIEDSQNTAAWEEPAMPPDRALQIVADWLITVAEKDPDLFRRIRELFKSADKPAAL